MIYETGAYDEGSWYDGHLHGKARRVKADGTVEDGNFKNDKFIS